MEREQVADYRTLLRRSIEEPAWFWDAVVRDLDLQFYEPYRQVLDTSAGIPWTRWFPGGRCNYVHNAVDKWAGVTADDGRQTADGSKPGSSAVRRLPSAVQGPHSDRLAIRWEGEDGTTRTLTYRELAEAVSQLAAGLRSLGVGKGDRVGIFMPMLPETAIATLAVSKIGAIYIPIFSGYGAEAVAARLRDAEAKLLLTADGFLRRGSVVPMKETADAAAAAAPSVERVVVFERLGRAAPFSPGRDVRWEALVDGQPVDLPTERTASEDSCLIIYTSGTTGRPKGAVHDHVGFPLKAAQDMAHCFDVGPEDTLFWFSDLGWMMGPWAIMGTLTLGATCMLYEGAPDFPQPDRLWRLVERHGITILGIAPTAIRSLMGQGDRWVEACDLSSLRILGSTGEPWNPLPWQWYFERVGGGRCPIINYSGGTEISGGILGCVTLRPIKPTCFNSIVPGMAADVLDEQGNPVRGQVGELVLKAPWPGMTRGFWRDPERYLETYWSRWPGIWVHGDWALVDEDDCWYILGRSDDTIKAAGKRVGPAEVESAACTHPAVKEAAAIGVPHPIKGEAVVVFAVLRPGRETSEALAEAIRAQVAEVLGKALRPDRVLFVADLPKTRNAKVMRRVIRARYLGQKEYGDLSALENPSAVEQIPIGESSESN
jgi:acetyl-CoA synthetase